MLEESRIGSDVIFFLTIFPRLWPRLSSRLLVTHVTILLYCMVITSPRTGSSRDNTPVASWKLGTSFEIFLSKKFFCKWNLTKGFYCTYLKVYKKVCWKFFFFKWWLWRCFFSNPCYEIGWQNKWNNFYPIDSKFCTIFTFSSHTEHVKRESIVIAWVKKKKILSFWQMFMICMS